jgi:RNA polymerase sigma-70 factor (ECF subfamily)
METVQDIWTEFGSRLRRFIGNRVNDSHAADDIAQDVLLKVQTRLDDLPPDDKLPAWVFAIARNAVIDHHRAKAIRDHATIETEPADDPGRNEEEAAVRDLSGCLARMIERLPEPYREAMKLADFAGTSQQEIADRAASPSRAPSRGSSGQGICSAR